MNETLQSIIEQLIVIDRCLDNMVHTAINPLHEVAEELRDLGIRADSNDILTIKYAPHYASVMAIEPIRELVLFEEGDTEEVVRSGHFSSEDEMLDSVFAFDVPYSYGDFAVILLSSVIELNNHLVSLSSSDEVEENVFHELKQVATLTTIHRSIAEKSFTLSEKQVLLNAAFYARKSLNDLSETLND